MYLVSASTPRASASSLSLSSRCPLEVICPADYVICPDLRCVPSYDLCSHVVACPPSTVVCGNLLHCGLSQEDCNFYVGVSCPRHAPLRCPTGERCAFSYSQCTNTPECPDGMVRCENGVCRASAKECLLQTPCPVDRPLRCPDGSCTNNPRLCPTDNPCPAFSPHMCTDGPYSGQCVPSPEQCLNQAGCPVKRPFRCMDGHCATSKTACGVASMANGCDPNTPYKCVDGSCVESPTECTLLNGCPLLTPYRTRTGLCVENPSKDPFIEENSRQVNCPASKPILCSDGIVRSSLLSRHLRVHAGTVQSVPKLLNLTSQPMQHGRLRLLAPPVPV